MDIISEILETDRLAEEKLSDARGDSEKILRSADEKIKQIRSLANSQIEDYKAQKRAEAKKKTDAEILKIRTAENVKIHSFEELYNKNHEAWEKEIFDEILAI